MDECETENCGSRRFHVGDDGYTYCSESHRQSRTGLVTINDEHQISLGRKSTRRETGTSDDEPLSQGQGLALYIGCLQWIMRKQVQWLISERGCPAELESVVRNIWILRLRALRETIEQESNDGASDTRSYTTHSDGDSSDTDAPSSSKRTSPGTLLGAIDLICLCYVGILLMRLPITIADLNSRVANGELLYYRSTRLMDARTRRRLPKRYLQRLDPQRELVLDTLQTAVYETLVMFNSTFGLVTPPLNASLVLHRWVESLLLPPESFAATLVLARLMDDDIAFDLSSKYNEYNILRLPEVRLACLLLTAVKLLFPLDGPTATATAKRPTELAATVIDWSTWMRTREAISTQVAHETHMSYRSAMTTTDADVLDMSESALDEYLDWYELNYIDTEPRIATRSRKQSTIRGQLAAMFPARNSAGPSRQEERQKREIALSRILEDGIELVQSTLTSRNLVADAEGVELSRPGGHFAICKSAAAMTGHLAKLYSEAAVVSGLSLDTLVKGSRGIERRLQKWQRDTQ